MLITLPVMSHATSDQDFKVINGSYKVDNIVITEKVKINGEAILGKNTVVKETMIVNGTLKVKGAIFEGELFSNGTTKLDSAWLKNDAHFSGNISANHCHFLKNIFLRMQKSTYTDCHFINVYVEEIQYVKTPPMIKLEKNSVISGDLTFKGGHGELYCDGSSSIEGVIYGGAKVS